MSESPLYLVVTIYPRPEQLAEATAQLQQMAANAMTEPGCDYQTLVVSDDEPGCLTMLEKFVSRAAWDEHMETEHNKRGNETLEPMLAKPSVLRLYTEA
ncbi:putative quinol monooxygenase [Microlunatus ginsengisoli]|uniref:putative quinol monooxygenase n=1 Tax=Microlunatus ginsengisoli TaxID=363863 RepID=UPI0031D00FB0